jgi:hypothetical protein
MKLKRIMILLGDFLLDKSKKIWYNIGYYNNLEIL